MEEIDYSTQQNLGFSGAIDSLKISASQHETPRGNWTVQIVEFRSRLISPSKRVAPSTDFGDPKGG